MTNNNSEEKDMNINRDLIPMGLAFKAVLIVTDIVTIRLNSFIFNKT